MRLDRLRWALPVFATVGAAFLVWSFQEARGQCRFVQKALTRQAELLARTLGPSLLSAAEASHDLEEMIQWKLLDNARLFAELAGRNVPRERIAALARSNGLDSVAILESDGRIRFAVGDDLDAGALCRDLGRCEQKAPLLLDPFVRDGIEHLAVASRAPSGEIALLGIHASNAQKRLDDVGVPGLLHELIGTGGVLYLEFHDPATGNRFAATWDDGVLPPFHADRGLHEVRGLPIFEVVLPIHEGPGEVARLRIGLDGRPLATSAATARHRSLLLNLTILGFLATTFAVALLMRLRDHEKRESARRLQKAELERERSERLAAAGALAAGLAHEVRSPLNAIGLSAQRLQRRLIRQENACETSLEITEKLRSEVLRLEGVLRSFLELASPVAAERRSEDLGQLARRAVDLLEEEARALDVSLTLETESVPVVVDPQSIHRAILNLVRNALQASSPSDRVIVSVQVAGDCAVLSVCDEGSGIPEELRGRAFDPFVSSRPEGTGLGLPLARRVAEEHGGTLELIPRHPGGTEARLVLNCGTDTEGARQISSDNRTALPKDGRSSAAEETS